MKTVIVNIPDKDEALFKALLQKFQFKNVVLSDEDAENEILAKHIDKAMKGKDVSEEEIFAIFKKNGIKI